MNEQALSVREAIVTRRSIKNFNGQPIEPEIIPEIIEDAVWAPNHGNRNPWRMIVATGGQYEQLLDVLKEFGVANWKQLSDEDLEKQMKKFSTASAAVFVIVPEDVRQKERLEDYAAASTLIQNIQLLAWDKGIGTCWKTPPFIDHPKFRERLGVQAGERIISMLQFGYFDSLPKAAPRKPVEEIITYFGSDEEEE
ncbi:nitroreductase [Sporosarcina sp. P37]|uniref:nitroreductase family protein n=1 Tax=unclassified Sporosarcina TaxID=2647733 RepID=UPI0009C029BD|nr:MULTISPECIES: nitroreductase [unclassified Sporosarcina]ARD48715.1 nitroreductase [Sporosarcina sp. P33]ARK25222.1 nitroreductase [Sporosarcina sp. P37]PID17170.1 nitroreductase [Sporosarcina sp. P35]